MFLLVNGHQVPRVWRAAAIGGIGSSLPHPCRNALASSLSQPARLPSTRESGVVNHVANSGLDDGSPQPHEQVAMEETTMDPKSDLGASTRSRLVAFHALSRIWETERARPLLLSLAEWCCRLGDPGGSCDVLHQCRSLVASPGVDGHHGDRLPDAILLLARQASFSKGSSEYPEALRGMVAPSRDEHSQRGQRPGGSPRSCGTGSPHGARRVENL